MAVRGEASLERWANDRESPGAKMPFPSIEELIDNPPPRVCSEYPLNWPFVMEQMMGIEPCLELGNYMTQPG